MTRKILLLTIFTNLYSREKDLSLSDEEIDRQMASRREEILNLLRQEEAQIDAITGRESRDGGLSVTGEQCPGRKIRWGQSSL